MIVVPMERPSVHAVEGANGLDSMEPLPLKFPRLGQTGSVSIMPRVSVVLLFLAALCWIDTTAVAMSLLPDFLIRKAQNVTEKDAEQDAEKVAAEEAGKEQVKTAEKQVYDQLFADKVVVKKSERKLYLIKQGKPFRTYSISLGFKPQGHKQRQGDGRTPEGSYMLDWRKSNSKFYKKMRLKI